MTLVPWYPVRASTATLSLERLALPHPHGLAFGCGLAPLLFCANTGLSNLTRNAARARDLRWTRRFEGGQWQPPGGSRDPNVSRRPLAFVVARTGFQATLAPNARKATRVTQAAAKNASRRRHTRSRPESRCDGSARGRHGDGAVNGVTTSVTEGVVSGRRGSYPDAAVAGGIITAPRPHALGGIWIKPLEGAASS
jgi:hypothetical protein